MLEVIALRVALTIATPAKFPLNELRYPRNGSWTDMSAHFFAFDARRDEDPDYILLRGLTQQRKRKSVQSCS